MALLHEEGWHTLAADSDCFNQFMVAIHDGRICGYIRCEQTNSLHCLRLNCLLILSFAASELAVRCSQLVTICILQQGWRF